VFFTTQDNIKYRIHCFLVQSLSFPARRRKGGTLLLTPRTRIVPVSRELALSRNMADSRAAVVQFLQQAKNPRAPAQVQQAQNLPAPVQVQQARDPPVPFHVQQGQNPPAQVQGQAP